MFAKSINPNKTMLDLTQLHPTHLEISTRNGNFEALPMIYDCFKKGDYMLESIGYQPIEYKEIKAGTKIVYCYDFKKGNGIISLNIHNADTAPFLFYRFLNLENLTS